MRISVTILAIMFVLTGGVWAQRSGIVGTFFDTQGSVIPGMNVTATDSRGKTAIAKSNDEGKFALELPVGSYSLEIGSDSQFCKVSIENYRVVNPREPMNLDILLAEGRSSHGGDKCRKKVIKF